MNEPARPATQKDIARAAGLSICTVSLALRGHPRISAETRARVLEHADRLGYVRDAQLAQLMAHVRNRPAVVARETVAFLAPFPVADYPSEWLFMKRFFDGAQERASALGFRLEEFVYKSTPQGFRRLQRVLKARGIRGLLIAPMEQASRSFGFELSDFTAMAYGFTLQAERISRVSTDLFGAVSLCLTQLRARGYRRIGLALDDDTNERQQHRQAAAFLDDQLTLPDSQRIPPFLGQTDTSDFEDWFAANQPDCVIGSRRELRYRLPSSASAPREPCGFAHLNVPSTHTDCAGIAYDLEEMGAMGIHHLAMTLQHARLTPLSSTQIIEFSGHWVDGPSVRADVATPPARNHRHH